MTCRATNAQNSILGTIRATISCPFHEHQTLHDGKTKENDGRLYYESPDQFALQFNNDDHIIVYTIDKVKYNGKINPNVFSF